MSHDAGAPLTGSSGRHDGGALLRALLNAHATGTLAVTHEGGVTLTLIEDGTTVTRTTLGEGGDTAAGHAPFTYHPHALPQGALHAVPELPSRIPGARDAALRAIPHLPPHAAVPPGLANLETLLAHAAQVAPLTLLASTQDGEAAATLLRNGTPIAARSDRHGRTASGSDALRTLARHAAGLAGQDPLTLHALPTPLAPLLAGILLGQTGDAPDGIRASEAHVLYLQGGVPTLRVAHPQAADLGRYAATPQLDTLPALPLPSDPPDWETRRYHLTLRGRDALDPMTDLAMTFTRRFGPSGQTVLRTLQRGTTIEATAAELGMDLDQLAAWVHELEADGLLKPT